MSSLASSEDSELLGFWTNLLLTVTVLGFSYSSTVVGKVVMEQVLLRELQFSPASYQSISTQNSCTIAASTVGLFETAVPRDSISLH
jgi:hypothetical protein